MNCVDCKPGEIYTTKSDHPYREAKAETAKVKETSFARISIDVEFSRPMDATALKVISTEIVNRALNHPNVDRAYWTQIVPSEANFDWQGQ